MRTEDDHLLAGVQQRPVQRPGDQDDRLAVLPRAAAPDRVGRPSSIQCASSMTYSAGWVRANEAAFTIVINRRRRASGSILGSFTSGSGMRQVIKQQQILGVGVGNLCAHPHPRLLLVQTNHPCGGAQQPRHHTECNVRGMGFTKG